MLRVLYRMSRLQMQFCFSRAADLGKAMEGHGALMFFLSPHIVNVLYSLRFAMVEPCKGPRGSGLYSKNFWPCSIFKRSARIKNLTWRLLVIIHYKKTPIYFIILSAKLAFIVLWPQLVITSNNMTPQIKGFSSTMIVIYYQL